MDTLDSPVVYKRLLVGVFLGCAVYWVYLFLTTQMSIVFDAYGYEQLGKLIYEQGWTAYFKNGPEREPFYPATIAFSMMLADAFHIHYHWIQKIIQILFLFSSQLLMLVLLNRLGVAHFIKLLTILYMGCSPALINATFSLFSEIIAVPFVLLVILCLVLSWKALYREGRRPCVMWAGLSAFSFVLLIFGKGAFQYVFWVCLIPFVCIFIRALVRQEKIMARNVVIYLAIVVSVVNVCLVTFKWMNKTYNGHFAFTSRYNVVFLGSAVKRSKPLTGPIVLSHLASIPGNGVCRMFFTQQQCDYADWSGAIDATSDDRARLLSPFPEKKRDEMAIRLALVNIREHPFQNFLFMMLEAPKMFFWESTRIGFVEYPGWLSNVFTARLFRFGLRFVVFLWTAVSIVFLCAHVCRHRKTLFDPLREATSLRTGLFVLLVIFSFTVIYASCYIITRYALPVASLFLLSNAVFFHQVYLRFKRRRQMS